MKIAPLEFEKPIIELQEQLDDLMKKGSGQDNTVFVAMILRSRNGLFPLGTLIGEGLWPHLLLMGGIRHSRYEEQLERSRRAEEELLQRLRESN